MTSEIKKVSEARLLVGNQHPSSPSLPGLNHGQLLKAAVTAIHGANEVLLNINGHSVPAKTLRQLDVGDEILVKVLLKNGELQLQIQDSRSSSSTLQDALRHYLPIQSPATPLFDHLQAMIQQGLPLSAQLQQLMMRMLQQRTPIDALTRGFYQGLLNSGVFLESQLRQAASNEALQRDFKALCLKFLAQLQLEQPSLSGSMAKNNLGYAPPLLPGGLPQPVGRHSVIDLLNLDLDAIRQLLHDEITQVLARIAVNQANHLMQDPKLGYYLMIDLPVNTPDGTDVIPIVIREHPSATDEPSEWSLSFAVDLSKLGAIQGMVRLADNKLHLKFHMDKPETLELFNRYETEIIEALQPIGIPVHEFKTVLGLEQSTVAPNTPHLLDIKI